MIRLGVAGRVLGRGVREADEQGGTVASHLSLGALDLQDRLAYLAERRIALYRLPAALQAWAIAVGPSAVRREAQESGELLAAVGALARRHGIRLTMHAGLDLPLASPDVAVAARAAEALMAQAVLLEALGSGRDGTIVVHVGGAHGDRAEALHRFAARWERLAEVARARLAVELDEGRFDLADLLRLHQMIGVPVVLDALHFQLNNPGRLGLSEALGLTLATWPRGVRPKVHYSTQRTEAHLLVERGEWRLLPPRAGQHADYLNPHEFAGLLRAAGGYPPFDVMLEAKAGDLALLRLREDVGRFAPDVAALVA